MSKELQLGNLIGPARDVHRDAVHVAVAPTIAGETLYRGDYVRLEANTGLAFRVANKCGRILGKIVGITDPFLNVEEICKGQKFWLWLIPGSIKTLRHHWTHPAFPEESEVIQVPQASDKSRQFPKSHDIVNAWATVEAWWRRTSGDDDGDETWKSTFLSEFGKAASNKGGCLPFETEGSVPPEIWAAYMVLTGKLVSNSGDIYFSCAC